MSVSISKECIACGSCQEVCPTDAIFPLEEIYAVDPELCTECVGFFDKEQCMEVCPVDAHYYSEENEDTEAMLIERARKIDPETTFPDDFKSHFKL